MITIQDKQFEDFISSVEITEMVSSLASKISEDYKGQIPLIIPVLNGSFMFAAELIKQLTIECEVEFAGVKSYKGIERGKSSTGWLTIDNYSILNGRDVIVVEDIVDSGITMNKIVSNLLVHSKTVKVVTLLYKLNKSVFLPDYFGRELDDEFVVGYGMDYNGFGRNLTDIYKLK